MPIFDRTRSLSDPHPHEKDISTEKEETYKKLDHPDENTEVNLLFHLVLQSHFFALILI